MSRSKLSLLCLLLAVISLSLWLPLAAQDLPANIRQIPVESIGFHGKLSPDGTTLLIFEDMNIVATDSVDPALLPIRVLDVASGEERELLGGFSDFTTDAAFTPDGSKLVTYHANGDVYVWNTADLSDPVNTWYTPLLGQGRIQFMPDDNTLVIHAGGQPQRFLLLDTTTGYITGLVGPRFSSFIDFRENFTQFPAQGDVMFAAFALSPDGSLLASVSINDEVALWSIDDNRKVTLRQPSEKFAQFNIRQLLFTPDGQSLLYFDRADNLTHIWDVAAREETGTTAGGMTMALSSDGSQLAWIGDTDGGGKAVFVAALADPDNVIKLFDLDPERKVSPPLAFLYFTPDGEQVVLGGLFAGELNNAIYIIDVG